MSRLINWVFNSILPIAMIVAIIGAISILSPSALSASASPKTIQVHVTVKEFSVELQKPTPVIHVGDTVEFVIQNKGLLSHELMLVDTNTDKMMKSMGDMQMGNMGSMKSMDAKAYFSIEPDLLTPKSTVTKPFTFKTAGTYILGCYLPGHQFMQTKIIVVK